MKFQGMPSHFLSYSESKVMSSMSAAEWWRSHKHAVDPEVAL